VSRSERAATRAGQPRAPSSTSAAPRSTCRPGGALRSLVYERARENLAALLEQGALRREPGSRPPPSTTDSWEGGPRWAWSRRAHRGLRDRPHPQARDHARTRRADPLPSSAGARPRQAEPVLLAYIAGGQRSTGSWRETLAGAAVPHRRSGRGRLPPRPGAYVPRRWSGRPYAGPTATHTLGAAATGQRRGAVAGSIAAAGRPASPAARPVESTGRPAIGRAAPARPARRAPADDGCGIGPPCPGRRGLVLRMSRYS